MALLENQRLRLPVPALRRASSLCQWLDSLVGCNTQVQDGHVGAAHHAEGEDGAVASAEEGGQRRSQRG